MAGAAPQHGRAAVWHTALRIAVAGLVAAAIIWSVLLVQAHQKRAVAATTDQSTAPPPSSLSVAPTPTPTPLTTRAS
jgi:hypothetical protein